MSRSSISKDVRKKYIKSISPIAQSSRIDLYGDRNIENQFDVLEQKGFIIIKFPSADKKLSGFSIEKSGRKCIYINSNMSKGRQHFSLWHEYYHLITGDGIGISSIDNEKYDLSECKAHIFASVFIMPEDKILEYMKKNNLVIPCISHIKMLKMANYFQVSYSALLYRLMDLFKEAEQLRNRFGTANNYNKLKEIANEQNMSLEYLEYEENTNDCYISPKFFKQVEKNYSSGRISAERVNFINKLLEQVQECKNE